MYVHIHNHCTTMTVYIYIICMYVHIHNHGNTIYIYLHIPFNFHWYIFSYIKMHKGPSFGGMNMSDRLAFDPQPLWKITFLNGQLSIAMWTFERAYVYYVLLCITIMYDWYIISSGIYLGHNICNIYIYVNVIHIHIRDPYVPSILFIITARPPRIEVPVRSAARATKAERTGHQRRAWEYADAGSWLKICCAKMRWRNLSNPYNAVLYVKLC